MSLSTDDPRLGGFHGPTCSCSHDECGDALLGHQSREDPTRTKTARRRFAQHLRGRWDAIKFHINRGIVDNDAFGLKGPDVSSLEAGDGDLDREFEAQVDTEDDITPGVGQFDYPSSADAAESFEDWLDEALDTEILQKYDGDRYVRKGYGQGIERANSQMIDHGLDVGDQDLAQTFRLPIHEDKLNLLYTRAFEELEGITEAGAQEIRRELTEGLSQGIGPEEIARNINDRVEKVGKTRSTVMARTEVVRAHSEGTLDRYESIAGDVDVTIQAEFTTTGDNDVCEICEALEGRRYSLQEARGLIPVHPQCRCAFIPLTNESGSASAAQSSDVDKREAYACDECEIPLAESRTLCVHCELAAGAEIPSTDLREVAG